MWLQREAVLPNMWLLEDFPSMGTVGGASSGTDNFNTVVCGDSGKVYLMCFSSIYKMPNMFVKKTERPNQHLDIVLVEG